MCAIADDALVERHDEFEMWSLNTVAVELSDHTYAATAGRCFDLIDSKVEPKENFLAP